MNTGILIALCGVMILIVFITIMVGVVLSQRIRKVESLETILETTVGENLGDISKLKKVTVGNYLDVIRIKKKLGMPTDSETTGEVAKSEES